MIAVRRMAAKDLESLAAIQDASPEAAQWTVRDYLGYEGWVALMEETVVGFVVIQKIGMDELEILTIAVAPRHRRAGVGRRLVEEALRALPEGGAAYLEVRATNEPARRFYTSIGFGIAGRRKEYYPSIRPGGGACEDAVVMKYEKC
jgi:ribosomal-protein-alanine N-acetyltransferase